MNWINASVTAISDIVLAPVSGWSPLGALLALSILAGIGMTVVFRYTSNQAALRRVAGRSKAQLQCLRLFKDDLGVALRCQRDLLKLIGLRLWYSLPPMVVLIVPFVLILTQLAQRYENRPLVAGESVVASIELSHGAWKGRRNDRSILVPAGIAVETPPLRDEQERAVYWRLRLDRPTEQPLRFRVGAETVEKSFAGAEDGRRLCTVSTRRAGPGFWDRLLRPAEPGFAPDSPVQSIDVRFPRRATPIFGVDAPWWATFIVVSMVTALLVRPFLKVQF